MYTLSLQRDFIAQHYLIGGDWGAENQPHSHHYKIEVMIEGEELDSHGYLIDSVDFQAQLNDLVTAYADKTLNDLPGFEGLNPSLERFCRQLCEEMDEKLYAPAITAISVKLWENPTTWAAYDLER
ncbi:MAG: 6-carboxytetrahydropterin synthase [Caldilineales bacterium]|nr:6-carboxytetrahydropterin synthase [Caldilineales bacterium]MCW5858597.1 6-carboxytetrahydropterin synthase [Caldilineales bacterium]